MPHGYTKKTFPNGLRLILAPEPGSLAATVLVLVETGSEYETKDINGISHFLEHMMFKGTARRPMPGVIATELDALGAEYNAFTAQEYTGYWAKARKEKAAHLLDIVTDLYLNPLFDANEIDKERGVIIEEINMYEDTPARRVHELFTTLLYGDQPAGWDIAGRKEVVRSVTRDDFLKYRAAHYVAPATIVVVAGAFDVREVTASVGRIFGHLPRGKKSPKAKTVERQEKPAIFAKFKESDQAHVVLGVRAFSVFDARRHALELLSHVLGGGMSSRLFHRIRGEMGAAYYVRSSTDLSIDHGHLSVSAGSDTKRAEDVVRAALEELARMAKDLVPPAELKKAKDHMIGNFILSLETSDELASFYGGQEVMTRRIATPAALIAKMKRVTAEDIRRVARTLLVDKHLNLAVIGPYKDGTAFERILTLGR